MSDGGKGSTPRPFSVGHDIFAKQFEATFGKKNENSPSAECPVAEAGAEGQKEKFAEKDPQDKLGT